MAAPVLPAVRKPWARFSRTSFEPDAHGAVELVADGDGGLFVHADAFGGIDDLDGQTLALQMLVEQLAKPGFGADQMHPYRMLAAGEDRATNLRLRRLVRTHSVENDVGQLVLAVLR